MAHLKRVAQMPPMPMPGMPPMPAAAPGGMPPMPGGAMPTMPMAAPGGAPQRTEIAGPLDTLAKILYDYNVTDLIQSGAGKKPDELAQEVWEAYGGDKLGRVPDGHIGNRGEDDKKRTPDQVNKERDANDDSKWQRLPQGKSIADVTTLEELSQVMSGLAMGTVKNTAKEQGGGGGQGGGPGGAPGGGGGGGMPMASTYKNLTRLAYVLDLQGMHEQADWLDLRM